MRALHVRVIVTLADGPDVIERRTDAWHTFGQDGLEQLRQLAHDRLDAGVFGLAARVPPETRQVDLDDVLNLEPDGDVS